MHVPFQFGSCRKVGICSRKQETRNGWNNPSVDYVVGQEAEEDLVNMQCQQV